MSKKTKLSSKGVDPCCTYSPSMYLDFDSVKEVKGVAIGDEVRVVVRGIVKSVEQRENHEGEAISSIRIEDFEAEIVPQSTQFDNLFDDESDD